MAAVRLAARLLCAVFLLTDVGAERLQYNVPESQDAGHIVADIPRDAGLADRLPPDVVSSLRYKLLSDDHPYLTVHPTSGVLTTAARLDRELVCPRLPACHLDVGVAVSPARFFQVIDVRVNIEDVNDNAPSFPAPSLSVEVAESAAMGSAYSLLLAEDADTARYGVSQYSLEDDHGVFSLQATPDAAHALSLDLIVDAALDRETTADYELRVMAVDGQAGDVTRHTATLTVHVSVTDANDNAPVFERASYSARVRENSPAPLTVVTVQARDADAGHNGRVTYALSAPSARRYGRLFTVDAASGVVSLTRSADRESEASYSLTITARDGGAHSRLASTTLDVIITDVNDNAPTITVNTLTTDGQAAVSENAELGTFVALLAVTDADEGDNGRVSCDVTHELFAVEIMDGEKMKVVTDGALETADVYNVTVTCADGGRPRPLTSATQLTVKVIDTNDFTPYFSQSVYSAEVSEEGAGGVLVAAVHATDRDPGVNGNVSYSLVPGEQFTAYFDLDPVSGVIHTARPLDREQHAAMTLSVVAADHGTPPLSATATLTVTVLDVNDVIPAFLQDDYTFVVVENESPKALRAVEARDADAYPNNVITYALQTADPAAATDPVTLFSVDAVSGMFSTLSALDREQQPVHYLHVLAYNAGASWAATSTASLTVLVADQNDNAPTIDFPALNTSVAVSSRLPVGAPVTTLRAHDLDSGLNGQVVYALSGAVADQGFFRVDSQSGVVYVDRDLSGVAGQTLDVNVRVSDEGEERRVSEATLTVEVTAAPGDTYRAGGGRGGSPGGGGEETGDEGRSMVAVVCVVAVSGVLICLLLVAIVFVLLRSRHTTCCASSSSSSTDEAADGRKTEGGVDEFSSVPADVEFETKCGLDDKVKYKRTLKQNNTRPDRAAEVAHSVNCLPNNARQEPLGRAAPPRRHPGTLTPCHEIGVSYIPEQRTNKRQPNKPLNEPCRRPDVTLDLDTSSASSGDVSNADSGRGASEEGCAPPYLPSRGCYNTMPAPPGGSEGGYPHLTTFKSPHTAPRTDTQTTLPARPNNQSTHIRPCDRLSPMTTRDTNVSPRQTMANKPRNMTRKPGDESPSYHHASYTRVPALHNIDEHSPQCGPTTPAQCGPTNVPFPDSNSLLKYKRQRAASDVSSDDGTSTSGSYAIDVDDGQPSVIVAHDVDV